MVYARARRAAYHAEYEYDILRTRVDVCGKTVTLNRTGTRESDASDLKP